MPESNSTPLLPPYPADALGITSTIPIEIPLAAGRRVIDLNNIFVRSSDPAWFIRRAEVEGFPRTCCSWIRGLYGLLRTIRLQGVIFVTGGDCSNTHAMMETLARSLPNVFTFSYPVPPDREALIRELERFAKAFGTTLQAAEKVGRELLAPIRAALAELDYLTWTENRVTGSENFQWLVSSSDFGGDPSIFLRDLDQFLKIARRRAPITPRLRLGLLGVPPIITDIHEFIESRGGSVLFNEIPRQFAMLDTLEESVDNLVDRYLRYTYPYGVFPRINDIVNQVRQRNLHALIHYTQAFCHRQIHDVVFRKELNIPMLTIEGENPGPCDPRTRLRLESFLEILNERQS